MNILVSLPPAFLWCSPLVDKSEEQQSTQVILLGYGAGWGGSGWTNGRYSVLPLTVLGLLSYVRL